MWEKIADTLNKCTVPKFRVDKRSVRDHVGILVYNYKHKKKLYLWRADANFLAPRILIISLFSLPISSICQYF